MRDLVLNFHQIELWDDAGMWLEACLADGKQILNTILSLLPYLRLMQQPLEALEDGIGANRS